jgi:SAM-dependent methyltransferase
LELLDAADPDPALLRDTLADLRRINCCWGGNRSALSALLPRISAWPRGRALRILDVGCGGGDLLRAVARRCRVLGIRPQLVGIDRSRRILKITRGAVSEFPEISLVSAEALEPPFTPGSFDFVLSSLLLHHLPPARAVDFLRLMKSLSNQGVIVSDLRRGRMEYLVTRLITGLFSRSRMTRLDAPLSVLRSLTLPEARELAHRAGWTAGDVRRSFPLRLLILDRDLV